MKRIVVLGTGPTGISAIYELIRLGVDTECIYIIDELDFGIPRINNMQSVNTSSSVYDVVLRERINQGFGKQGVDLTDSENSSQSPSSIWGTSCLPPFKFESLSDAITSDELRESYQEIAYNWEIQSESSPDKFFEITGERIGKMPRKTLSRNIVKNGYAYHARLAVSTESETYGCKLSSKCFTGCPNNAPWNPKREVAKLRQLYPKLHFIKQRILQLNLADKTLCSESETFEFDVLFLAIGAQNSKALLAPIFDENILVETTPVILIPILTRKRSNDEDYFESFHFTDLVIPHIVDSNFLSLMQVYLPSVEITGRVILQMPHFIQKMLAKTLFLTLQAVYRRIAIGMIFLGSKPVEDKSISKFEVQNALKWYRVKLRGSELLMLPLFKKYLLQGASYHFGAIHFENEEKKGINSQIFEFLASKKVYLVDTSILPKLPPGPHTSIAAAYTKLVVRNALK